MNYRCRTLPVVLILAGLVFVSAAGAGGPDPALLDEFIAAQMQIHRIPGLALAVTRGSEIVYSRGWGTAGSDRPLAPDTPVYIGSISKSLTAVAALQLVDREKLDLDAPVVTYLPWFAVADEGVSRAITVRQLLHHRSGLSDRGYTEQVPGDATLEASVRALRAARPVSTPGTRFDYFNPNYQVLGLIVETVSGQAFGAYMDEHVFGPLGMADSRAGGVPASLARGHGVMFGYPIPRRELHLEYAVPAGFIVSTASDMARYLIMLNQHGTFADHTLLSPDSVRLLREPGGDEGYAMGWIRDRTDPTALYHSGDLYGFHGYVWWLPDRETGVVLLVNQNGLIQQLTGFPAIRAGIMNLLDNRPPDRRVSARVAGAFLLVLAAVTVILPVRRLARLDDWLRLARTRSSVWRIASVGARIAVPLSLVALIQVIGSTVLGRTLTLATAVGLAPDLVAWLGLLVALSVVEGVARIVVLARAGGGRTD